jgi:flagellar assembly factor FliW
MGYAEYRDFGLAAMPDPRLDQFKLLQSFSEPGLSFAVLPLAMDNGMIEPSDVADACKVLGVNFGDAGVLVIVATRQIGATTQVSVNLRAPIVVDTENHTGWQYVLGNSRYPVRHVIANAAPAADSGD